MKNKILYGVIGLVLASVASVGVAVAQEHFANPSEELSIQSVFGLGDDGAGDSNNESKNDDNKANISNQTQTNASVSSDDDRGGDDGDSEDGFENEGDDDSGGGRTGQSSVTNSQQSAQSGSSASAKTFTMAEVGKHNNQSSCYTAISGSVYDVTSWISQHPGGASAILSLCGIDGTAAFTGQHGGQARPASELASFKIGTLAK